MSCIFQNIDPPPPSPPGECVPPAFIAGGGHTRRVERGVGGQYFGNRKKQLCTLPILPISNPLWTWPTERKKREIRLAKLTIFTFFYFSLCYLFYGWGRKIK
jgi:hypothetical protein